MRRGEVSRARLKIRVFYNDRLVYTTQETCVYYVCVCVCVSVYLQVCVVCVHCVCGCVCGQFSDTVWDVY